jgi:hypothetical protein
MNEPNPELLALVYLSAKGISRKSLLEAASSFPSDEDTGEDATVQGTYGEDATSELAKRGRPMKESMKLTAFYFLQNHLKNNGKLPTDKMSTECLEEVRKLVVESLKKQGMPIPEEFRTEVRQTTVKQWRREIEKIRIENEDLWNRIYDGLLIEVRNAKNGQQIK